MHSFIHACKHAFMHSCIRIHSFIHSFMHSCIHAFMHSCIHAFMHSCIHAFMHFNSSRCNHLFYSMHSFQLISFQLTNNSYKQAGSYSQVLFLLKLPPRRVPGTAWYWIEVVGPRFPCALVLHGFAGPSTCLRAISALCKHE